MKLVKMLTGFVAKSGWLRIILFAVIATGSWHLWSWVITVGVPPAWAFFLAPVTVGVVMFVNIIALVIATIDGDLWEFGLLHIGQRLPFAMWAQMTHDGEDVRLWVVLAWLFLLPTEMFLCAVVPLVVIIAVIGRILNIRIK